MTDCSSEGPGVCDGRKLVFLNSLAEGGVQESLKVFPDIHRSCSVNKVYVFMNTSKGETLIILRVTAHGLQVTLFACLQISVENK